MTAFLFLTFTSGLLIGYGLTRFTTAVREIRQRSIHI